MFLKQIDLTTALRPSYLPDEVLLFVQDNVGLYEGKLKLPRQQNGQVYLTSHRICYVDKNEPRKHSVALDLKDVERYEFYAGFLKSSPKITLVPKPAKRSSLQARPSSLGSSFSRSGTNLPVQRPSTPLRAAPAETSLSSPTPATWVCTICSFSNPVPSNFDPTTANTHTPLPPCLACGIKPTLIHVLKASISNITSRHATPRLASQTPLSVHVPPTPALSATGDDLVTAAAIADNAVQRSARDASFQCPRCTFLNHPSLLSCEICGAPLISRDLPVDLTQGGGQAHSEAESPGLILNTPLGAISQGLESPESVKISFRGGGEKIFYERLKGSMTQRKWLLQGAPPIPRAGDATDSGVMAVGAGVGASAFSGERVKMGGIAGLEHRGQALRKNNELMIGSAFEDLEALMASAKEIVALAEDFARQVHGAPGSGTGSGSGSASENALLVESASQLGLITTKDIVGSTRGSSGDDKSLYLSELARNLAELLTDDARGVLRRAGGIMSLVDLWAMFNRARGGVELVSPLDFAKAAALWESLRLPVRLRTFKSGVMVVQARDRTDDTTIRAITAWLCDLHTVPPSRPVAWDWQLFGRGVTAQDVAERFGWSIGVAEEELELAEERGALCREEGIEGLKFWKNYIDTGQE